MSLLRLFPAEGKIKVKGGASQGFIEIPSDFKSRRVPRMPQVLGKGSEYAAKYRAEEERSFLESMRRPEPERCDVTAAGGGGSDLFKVEDLTSVGTLPNILELEAEKLTQVYENYAFNPLEPSEQLLPIHDEKEDILKIIETNPVCVITGETGCGKSTQIPQFILDDHASRRKHCNIIVTQPRRIAAITIAQHVSEQRNWSVGGIVGYQVGLDKQASEDTRLLYCTTGVFLEKLIQAKELNQYTHILLDEVHEREEDMDFAMLIVRKFMRTNSPNVKVVLMSATIDASRFASYFEFYMANQRMSAPVYEIVPKRKFDVRIHYLDELKKHISSIPEFNETTPTIQNELMNMVHIMIQGFNNIDATDFKAKRCLEEKGAVLIFLPGLYYIERFFEYLTDVEKISPGLYNLWLCPLHSSITKDEQEKVRRYAPNGKRKVILSTNIAESSITIPDVKYVIDFCLTKHLVADPVTGFSSLQLAWASHTNCIQREGRVGRVQDGRVYRMVPKAFYMHSMRKDGIPEMQRCPLEIVVLKCKKLMEDECPLSLISNAMDPPDLDNYEKTIQKLKENGAMLVTCRGQESTEDGDITFMGKVMASLPLDIHITKLILLGHIFGVQEEAIIMGCCMSERNIFSEPFQRRLRAYNNKLLWADSSESDPVAYLNAYMVWRQQTALGKFKRSKTSEEQWASRYMLQLRALHEVVKLEDEIKRRLKAFNIVEIKHNNSPLWEIREKPLILKLVLAGAFYPHYFSTSSLETYSTLNPEVEAVKMLSSKNPYHCVYVQQMPQPAPLYFDQLKDALRTYEVCQNVQFHYDDTRKVIVEFEEKKDSAECRVGETHLHSNIPGAIVMPVYRAVKLRQLNIPIVIKPLRRDEVQKELTKLTLSSKTSMMSLPTEHPPMIKTDDEMIEIIVTHIETPSNFYCQLVSYENHLVHVIEILKDFRRYLKPLTADYVENFIYLAPFAEDGEVNYYRAKVTKEYSDRGDRCVEVYFIDYGNYSPVLFRELREMTHEEKQRELDAIPPLAINCRLARIAPAVWKNDWGDWCKPARIYMMNTLMNKPSIARVYSFVHGVAAIEIFLEESAPAEDTFPPAINDEFVAKGFADYKEEPYFSKEDHNRRLEAKRECTYGQSSSSEMDNYPLKVDPFKLPVTKGVRVELKGPFSPLEMKVHSLVRCSTDREIRVEWNSVNSVLLNSDPADPHNRLLVAKSVSQSSDGRRLTLNHTTVLPNMPGLPALLCLMFAPYVELRTDPNHSRYTGALCGLGMSSCDSPIFSANDMEIRFDVEFVNDDFIKINKLRYWLNERFCRDDSEDMPEGRVKDIQEKIKFFTWSLLTSLHSRPSTPVYHNERPFQWNQIPKRLLRYPFEDIETVDYSKVIYQFMLGVDINVDNDRENIKSLLEKTTALERSLKNGITPKSTRCDLCNMDFDYSCQLKDHVNESSRHAHLLEWLISRNKSLKQPLSDSKFK